jgi:hypothetical protein
MLAVLVCVGMKQRADALPAEGRSVPQMKVGSVAEDVIVDDIKSILHWFGDKYSTVACCKLNLR